VGIPGVSLYCHPLDSIRLTPKAGSSCGLTYNATDGVAVLEKGVAALVYIYMYRQIYIYMYAAHNAVQLEAVRACAAPGGGFRLLQVKTRIERVYPTDEPLT